MLDAEQVCRAAARRAARAVARDRVVRANVSAEGVRRPDRYRGRLDSGRMYRAVNLLPRSVLAQIARGRDDYDARVYELAHGAAYGVVLVGLDGRSAEAHVYDAYV